MHPHPTLRTLLTLPLLIALASPVLAEDDKVLLAKCDVDRNGTINGGGNDLPPAAWTMIEKERVCMHEYELDQLAKAMPDIRKRCDLNGNGRIDHPEPLITPLMVSGKETNGKKAYRSLPEEVRKQVDAEKKCVQDASIAQKDASIAQKDASIAKGKAELAKGKAELAKEKAESARLDDDYRKMIQILALLRPTEARTYLADEIQKVGREISEAKAANNPARVKPLEHRLNILRTEQQKLK